MPVSRTSTNAVRAFNLPHKKLHITSTIVNRIATISIPIPEGVNELIFRAPGRVAQPIAVVPNTTLIYSYTRDEIGTRDHPRQTVSFAARGFRANTHTLKFQRTSISIPIPVTSITLGTISAGTAAGTNLTYTPYIWGGDYTEQRDTIWTSPDGIVPFTDTGERWLAIPDDEGMRWKRVAMAYGPTIANALVNGWITRESTVRTITARAAAPAITSGQLSVLRSVNRPTTQSVNFTPIVKITGLNSNADDIEVEFTAAALDTVTPEYNRASRKSDETDAWELFDKDHPVASGATDAALFQTGSPRNPRLRFRWRPDELTPWSPESPVVTVPAVVTPGETIHYIVTGKADLEAKMASATSGQVIGIPADMVISGGIDFRNKNKGDPGIKIIPVDRTRPPIFLNGTINLSGSTGITFDGTTHRNTVMDTDPSWYPDGVYRFPLSGNRAFTFDDTVRFTLRNCTIEGHHLSLGQRRTTDLLIEWCRFRLCGMDTIRLYDGHLRPIIRNNLFDEPNVDHRRVKEVINGVEPRHVDFIQFANNVNGPGVRDFIIENNAFYGSYGYHQAIFMNNEYTAGNSAATLASNGNNNGIVRGNYIESRHRLAILISGADNILVEGNLIRTKPPTTTPNAQYSASPPQIAVGKHANNGVRSTGIVRNNVYPPKDGISDNTLDLVASGGQALLSVTGNKRSNTEFPPDWLTGDVHNDRIGPYGYLAPGAPLA